MKLDCPMYTTQTDLKGVYSCNNMWSLKSLVMLKCESKLVYMQYSISDSQTMFLCSVSIILEIIILECNLYSFQFHS